MLEHLAGFITSVITHFGYTGIFVLMAIESACVPLPSEVIMPFAGFLAGKGAMNLWAVAFIGALGCVAGSLVVYLVSAWGGRPFLERYGRYLLISRHDLDTADRLFTRHGDLIIFIGRLLPVVRGYISIPAGIARMSLWRFNLYTFVGSFLWCLVLAWIGVKLGQHWNALEGVFHRFSLAIVALLAAGFVWYVWRHLKLMRQDGKAGRVD